MEYYYFQRFYWTKQDRGNNSHDHIVLHGGLNQFKYVLFQNKGKVY